MGSSSGNSNWSSSQMNNSGCEEDLMEQRKRKRMQSNRESARRSRMRKQKHLDDLVGEIGQLRKENNQILTSINLATQHLVNIEAQNSVLSAQKVEISQRLESLNDILSLIKLSSTASGGHDQVVGPNCDSFINPFNLPYVVGSEIFQY